MFNLNNIKFLQLHWVSIKCFKIITQSITPRDDGFNTTRSLTTLYTHLLHNMLRQQFYLTTLTTILVFSFVISCFIHVSTTYLQENLDVFSSIVAHPQRRNAADTAHDGGSIRTSQSSREYTEKYQKTIDIPKIRRKRFSATRTATKKIKKRDPEENYWHYLKSNLTNLTAEDILKNDYVKNLKLSRKELRALEKRTKKQYKCDEWHRERKKRYVLHILSISFYYFINYKRTYWVFRLFDNQCWEKITKN